MNVQQKTCPLCGSDHQEYEFRTNDRRLMRCVDCELLFSVPFPGADVFETLDNKSLNDTNSSFSDHVQRTSKECFLKLQSRGLPTGGRILVAGHGSTKFGQVASAQGIDVVHTISDGCRQVSLDACVLFDVLGETAHPAEQLSIAHESLVSGGLLMLRLPMLDSQQARKQQGHWSEFKTQRAAYFNTHNLAVLLVRSGFCDILNWQQANGATFLCRKVDRKKSSQSLSIVLPIYNEKGTFKQLIDTVLGKTIVGLDREIVIVESNSTDGSRELVQRYESHPEVKVIYENRPRGKGHAVRNGLKHASGDIVLIQDADLEYDIDDYDALLEPIIKHHRLFVLGSRHKGNWKMREFENRRMLSMIFNSGQVFFTWLINITCNVKLEDPFTMYKVFHRECLYGLKFESNRFDLDWEIVIKFVRKGLVPMEIPVNYVSRSFGEGKKVKPILDPLLWIVALIKFRYGSLYGGDQKSKPDTA